MRNNWFFFYVRNNWFEILNFYSNLVVFAAIKTTSNKKGKKILVTHNQKCKKKKKKKIWRIYTFFNRHETCLSILATISCNFQFVNTYIYIVWSNHYTILNVFLFCLYIK